MLCQVIRGFLQPSLFAVTKKLRENQSSCFYGGKNQKQDFLLPFLSFNVGHFFSVVEIIIINIIIIIIYPRN